MNKKIINLCGASALACAAATQVAKASTYYQTTDFQTSNVSSNAMSDFISGMQFGEAPENYGMAPAAGSTGVTLAAQSGNSSTLGLIDTFGGGATGNGATGSGAGIYADTDAVLNFTLVNGPGGQPLYDTFGMGERVAGGGTDGVLTTGANHYPAYVVSYDLGTITLYQLQAYTGNFGTAIASASIGALSAGDSYQLEMTTSGSTSPTVTAVLTDTTADSVLADLSATGTLNDPQGSVGFWGGSDGSGNYNITHGINATAFSVDAPTAAPEPSVIGLVTLAGSGLMLKRRRRAR
jgi:hypothetical protein